MQTAELNVQYEALNRCQGYGDMVPKEHVVVEVEEVLGEPWDTIKVALDCK